jgi:hypothetical protein
MSYLVTTCHETVALVLINLILIIFVFNTLYLARKVSVVFCNMGLLNYSKTFNLHIQFFYKYNLIKLIDRIFT